MKKYEIKTIKQIANTQSGGTPSRKVKDYYNGDIPWVKSGELRENIITETEEKITQTAIDKSSAKLLPINTLLVAMYGANVGRVAILGIEAATNQAICAIQPKDDLLSTEYLYYYFIYYKNQLLDKAFGGAQKNISQQVIKNLEIPFPTIQQQKQIVSKIKDCFTLLDKSEEKLKQVERKLQDTLLSARLKAFDTYNSTYKQISELTEVITKGSTPTSYGYPYTQSGINFLKVESIEDQIISPSKINCFISEETNNFLSRSKLQEDDILFSIAGTIGKVAIVGEDILPANTNQALAIIRGYKKFFKPKYLYYFLQSTAIEELKQKARGGAMNNISLNDIKSFLIPTPDFQTQEKVIKYLEKTESIVKRSLENVRIQTNRIQTLRQSILKKAFEGKLI